MSSAHSDTQTQYFLDTSFLVSVIDASDVHHRRAAEILPQLPNPESRDVFLSDVAINESANVLARRCRRNRSLQRLAPTLARFRRALGEYPILCLYDVMKDNYGRILDLMAVTEGALSFHDCLIALFLKEVSQVKLVSFDEEFKNVGWLDVLN